MTMNRIATASLIAASIALEVALLPFTTDIPTMIATASADDQVMVTVDGHDYPVCHEEDCSDQVGQIGVWTNRSGHSYLILGEDVTIAIVP